MISTVKRIYGAPIECANGIGGRLDDLLFDDRNWRVRHIVVAIGHWLSRRQVLLPPGDVERTDWTARKLVLAKSVEEVREFPSIDTDLPVAYRRQMEDANSLAWEGVWAGMITAPVPGDPHLRNTKAITGDHVDATDGTAGRVADIILDDQSWEIRYLLVEAGIWRERRRAVISPPHVREIDWDTRTVRVNLSRDEIEHTPECHDPAAMAAVSSAGR